jgi:hypothetical protein
VKFGSWYPLSDAAQCAPASPGVFQVRVAEGLVEYPRGKSAMIHYEAALDVRAAAAGFAATHRGAPWWCRHTIEPDSLLPVEAEALAARLLRDFTVRFGTPPAIPPSSSVPSSVPSP